MPCACAEEICRRGSISKKHQLTNLNKCGKFHACIRNSTILALSRIAMCFVTQYNSTLSSFVPNFRILFQVVAEKSLTEENVHMYYLRVIVGKNEKLKKESKMRISVLIFIYKVHFAYLKVYTKFQNTGFNRS